MQTSRSGLSVLQSFDFSYPPVGVKFCQHLPGDMEQLPKSMALCEMVREAQGSGQAFYITSENEDCSGRYVLGMAAPPAAAAGGQVGIKFGIFNEPRANSRLLLGAPNMAPGTVNYVAFSPIETLGFDPDLLVITATPGEAEVLLRAMSYSTGERWFSQTSLVGACAWLFVYPYQSGKVNYIPTGMTFGMKGRKVYPEGYIILSIPYNWIPVIVQNLERMEWVLPAYRGSREDFLKLHDRIMGELFGH